MATVLNIPLTTLQPGVHTFGPVSAPVGVQTLDLTLSRIAGSRSLNAAPATTQITAELDVSYDNGTTWQMAFRAGAPGGTYTDDEVGSPTFGQVITSFETTQGLQQPTTSTTDARAIVTITGTAVSVSGSLTLS